MNFSLGTKLNRSMARLSTLLLLVMACNLMSGFQDEIPAIQPSDPAEIPQSPAPRPTTGGEMAATEPASFQFAVYFVAPNGDDQNSGAETQPWRTIQKAADTLVAGEMVYIRHGIYTEQITPANSGNEGKPITYAAYPNETVTIDGSDIPVDYWGALFQVFELSHITISGLKIIHSSSAGILVDEASHIVIQNNYTYDTFQSGIGVWSSSHVIIEGNEVELANNDGDQENISVGGVDNFEVRYNEIHHGGPGSEGGEGICIKDGSSNGLVYGNHVHHLPARLGIYIDAWDKHTYNIDVFQNLSHDNGDSGFTLASESGGLLENVRVFNNIAYHNMYDGISVSGCCTYGGSNHPLKDIYIINNTFYNNGWSDWGGGVSVENAQVSNLVVRNNIFSQNLLYQVLVEANLPPGSLTIDHNLIDGFRDFNGETYGSDYVESDPLFKDASGADFHLDNGSPAIDACATKGSPEVDYDGSPRPQDGDGDGQAVCDIGALEAKSAAALAMTFLPIIRH